MTERNVNVFLRKRNHEPFISLNEFMESMTTPTVSYFEASQPK